VHPRIQHVQGLSHGQADVPTGNNGNNDADNAVDNSNQDTFTDDASSGALPMPRPRSPRSLPEAEELLSNTVMELSVVTEQLAIAQSQIKALEGKLRRLENPNDNLVDTTGSTAQKDSSESHVRSHDDDYEIVNLAEIENIDKQEPTEFATRVVEPAAAEAQGVEPKASLVREANESNAAEKNIAARSLPPHDDTLNAKKTPTREGKHETQDTSESDNKAVNASAVSNSGESSDANESSQGHDRKAASDDTPEANESDESKFNVSDDNASGWEVDNEPSPTHESNNNAGGWGTPFKKSATNESIATGFERLLTRRTLRQRLVEAEDLLSETLTSLHLVTEERDKITDELSITRFQFQSMEAKWAETRDRCEAMRRRFMELEEKYPVLRGETFV